MERINGCASHKSVWIFSLSLTLIGTLHVLWSHWIHNQHHLHLLPTQLALNLVVGLALFWLFKIFRLGWGIRRNSGDMPVLNA
jgi:hypothetical protein